MRRVINFLIGFALGVLIGGLLGLLVTPQSGQALKAIFEKEYAAKKAELEAQFSQVAQDSGT